MGLFRTTTDDEDVVGGPSLLVTRHLEAVETASCALRTTGKLYVQFITDTLIAGGTSCPASAAGSRRAFPFGEAEVWVEHCAP